MVIESATGFFHAGRDVADVRDFGSNNPYDRKESSGMHFETIGRTPTLQHIETFQTTYEQPVHDVKLYQDGMLIKQPAPSRDPKDPMNLPLRRRILGVFCLSMFGALAASAEIILGAMLPVFAIEYSPSFKVEFLIQIADQGGFPQGVTPLTYLQSLGGPPLFYVYLLAACPVLVIGVSNLLLVPLAIAIGRRPVILITGVIAIAGACWAGSSQSLASHIGARCVQALGAGSVESLIPFIIQDTVFVHQRNTWISAAFACQGVIIIAVGFSAPYIVINQNLTWRYVYYITAICASVFLIGVFFFLPETRWNRTRSEMEGIPRDDAGVEYTPRSWGYDLAIFRGKANWKKGVHALLDTLQTFFYPQIFFITMLNSAMISTAFAASYTTAPALLTKPWSWQFQYLGFCLVPVLIASVLVGLTTGVIGDKFANWAAKKRGKREPENQLLNLILPAACGLIGCVLFGVSGQDQEKYGWPVFLTSLGFLAFGFLGANSVGAVYVLECYPHLAGPALVSLMNILSRIILTTRQVNIASFRCIIAFFLTFYVCDWIIWYGYLNTYLIYFALIAAFSVAIPVVYVFGPAWRKRLPATNLGKH